MYADAHIHLFDLATLAGEEPVIAPGSLVCASSWRREEFEWHERYSLARPGSVFLSFGVHPQEPDEDELGYLTELVDGGRLSAVGECGFDRFTAEYRSQERRQRAVWDVQVDLARRAGLPLVVHCRKAMDLVFADAKRLSALSAVVFHGWPGSPTEAASLLARGVNAYFSAGKGLLRGDRSLAATVVSAPAERLLAETDAPWMTLRGEARSEPADIAAVTERIAALRCGELNGTIELLRGNFRKAFSVS